MKIAILGVAIVVWLYLLRTTRKGNLLFWRYIIGSMGLFVLMMVTVRPIFTDPLAKGVAAIAGLYGSLTDTFSAYFKYGILFVDSAAGAITLQIDFECSGIIEIMAFIALMVFYQVYEAKERIIVCLLGVMYIVVANVLRIIVICEMIYFMGPGVYHIAHTVIGRIVFYALSIVLYFYVFTKPQIVRMKLGKFSYGNH